MFELLVLWCHVFMLWFSHYVFHSLSVAGMLCHWTDESEKWHVEWHQRQRKWRHEDGPSVAGPSAPWRLLLVFLPSSPPSRPAVESNFSSILNRMVHVQWLLLLWFVSDLFITDWDQLSIRTYLYRLGKKNDTRGIMLGLMFLGHFSLTKNGRKTLQTR